MLCHVAAASLILLSKFTVTTAPLQAPVALPAAAKLQRPSNSTAFGVESLLTALDAGPVTTGSLSDARLSSNIAKLASAQVFSGQKTLSSAPILSATGAPFSVAGQTVVSNLNCELFDGLDITAFLQSIPSPLVVGTNVANAGAVQGTASN